MKTIGLCMIVTRGRSNAICAARNSVSGRKKYS